MKMGKFTDVIGCLPMQLEPGHQRELQSLVDGLPNCCVDENQTRFKLVQLYGEDPSLLDPVLPAFVDQLLGYMTWPDSGMALTQLSASALEFLQILMRVRGYKVVMRLLPHEVNNLKPLIVCLERYSQCTNVVEVNANTAIVFVLSVWLMIICKNPFNLTKFDAGTDESIETQPIADRIVGCLTRLQPYYTIREQSRITSNLLAQILTRNEHNLDVVVPRIDEAVDVIRCFESEKDGGVILISTLRFVNALFKHGKRQELRVCVLQQIDGVLDRLLGVNCVNSVVRNLIVKLLQRIAFVLMRPRLAEWRYRCGHRSIEDSLRSRVAAENDDNESTVVNPIVDKMDATEPMTDTKGNEEEIPYDLVEKLIDELLSKIHDRDGVVRWTAAKGVARICARLPQAPGGEVVSAVLCNSFVDGLANATAWHGGCLAVAELCRRGCLLPEHVPEVVDKILKRALFFDESLEAITLGVGVRDAACYICWAIARGYERHILYNCLPDIAGLLVCLALFDREINVRRAASAAFQENVGRNGCFPHGIQVLTLIGYTDVTMIRHSYLELSLRVAVFDAYRRPILEHLAKRKATHWDESLRELAADALERLAPTDIAYCRDTIFPLFISQLANRSSSVRHGALLGIAGLLRGLTAASVAMSEFAVPSLFCFLHDNIGMLYNHRLDGFALLTKAFCKLIGAMCAVGIPFDDKQLGKCHDLLDAVIADTNNRLHPYATAAFTDLMRVYEGDRFTLLRRRIHDHYFVKMRDTGNELTRCSAIVPLAQISPALLAVVTDNDGSATIESGIHGDVTLADAIVAHLVDVLNDGSMPKWAFARAAAIKCITSIVCKFTPANFPLAVVLDVLSKSSDDNTTTESGDVGRFVRRESIMAFSKLLPIVFSHGNDPKFSCPPDALLTTVVERIVTRCCEAIDNVRSAACKSMAALLRYRTAEPHHSRPLPIPERQLLESIFYIDDYDENNRNPSESVLQYQLVARPEDNEPFLALDWLHARGFVRLRPLLHSPTFGRPALEGFILSAGSIASWTSTSAYDAIALHVKSIRKDEAKMEAFIDDILSVADRIAARQNSQAPVVQLLLMLLNDRAFIAFEKNPDLSPSFTRLTEKVLKIAITRGTPKMKVLTISVLGALLQFSPTSNLYRNSISTLVSFLQSPYAIIRESATEQLFNAINLIMYDGDEGDEQEAEESAKSQMIQLLTTTPWANSQMGDELNARREELLQLFYRPTHDAATF